MISVLSLVNSAQSLTSISSRISLTPTILQGRERGTFPWEIPRLFLKKEKPGSEVCLLWYLPPRPAVRAQGTFFMSILDVTKFSLKFQDFLLSPPLASDHCQTPPLGEIQRTRNASNILGKIKCPNLLMA